MRACAAVAGAAGISAVLRPRPTLGVAAAAMLHLAAATPLLSGCNESAYHQLQDDVLVEPLADRQRHDGRAAGPRVGRRSGPGEDRAVWGCLVIPRLRFRDFRCRIGTQA